MKRDQFYLIIICVILVAPGIHDICFTDPEPAPDCQRCLDQLYDGRQLQACELCEAELQNMDNVLHYMGDHIQVCKQCFDSFPLITGAL